MKVPEPLGPLDAVTRAASSLEGLSVENTARVPQLLEAMCSVGTGRGLHTTLARICETATELAGARFAAIGVLDETGESHSDFVSHGTGGDVIRRIGHPPDGRTGLAGVPMRGQEPIRLADPAVGPRAAGLPPAPPPVRTFLDVPIRAQGEVLGNFYLAEKPGGGEFSDYDVHMVRVLATEAGNAIGNARLYEAARQRERWIDGSVAVTTALLTSGDAGGAAEALSVVAEQIRRLADSVIGVVLLRTEDGALEVVAVSDDHPTVKRNCVVPAENAVTRTLLAGESLFVDDLATDPRVTPALAADFGPGMLLPLRADGRVLGALVMPRARGARRFGERERVLADQFAAQSALALMMAEAQRDRERLAVLEDRDRIARDLHDLVIQRLFATGMTLATAQRGTVAPEVHQGIDKAVDELDVTIQEIRTAIFALQQGPAEAPAGVRTRVLREINMAAVPLGFRPSHRFLGQVDTAVGELAGRNLIAALREALSNAFRHAQATRIEVVVDAAARLPDGRAAASTTTSIRVACAGRKA
ncbi:GAF domain-containing sensor histidine kinase [Streptomyces lushanensis]|uniref:GAF domain-containing sensor histidine kinase n=1 Tax=Streptomyces lushanensis TaxID=1434255 RepID=UPI00099FD271|nr:GAF domain-containing protein [Streptomyces lushanensis]